MGAFRSQRRSCVDVAQWVRWYAARLGGRDHAHGRAGVELEERLVAKFRASIAREGLSDRVTAVEGDIREFDLSPATVIVTYLLPEALALLQPQLVAALRRGVRLVCSTWALPGLRPTLLSEPETGRDVRLYLFTRESVAEGGGAGADDGADAAAPAV